MKINEIFPSRWLKTTDLGPDGLERTIRKVTLELIGEEREQKPIMSFKETDKQLVLNVTNCNTIADLTGSDDTDSWPGHRIKLVRVKVQYGAKTVDAIRVEAPDNAPAQEPVQSSARVTMRKKFGKPESPEKQEDEDPSEIPF